MFHAYRRRCGNLGGQLLLVASVVLIHPTTAQALTWEQEVMADNPLSWWRLDEPAQSSVFADSGSVGLDLNASSGIDFVPGDYNDDGANNALDSVVWRNNRGATGTPGEVPGDGTGDDLMGIPDGDVDNFDHQYWRANFGFKPSIVSGLPSLPALGSAIDTTLGHLEAFDDDKAGQLSFSTRQGTTPVGDFTYEAWVMVTNDQVPVFASIGGNSVNGNPDGAPTAPPDPENGLIDQYGTRICASTDIDLFCGGLTGQKLEHQGGAILFEDGTAQAQPTKDLHFQKNEFGVPEDQRLEVVAGQWYYIVAQWSEAGFNGDGIPQAGFIGHVYWQDDQGVIHELHRDHGTNFDFASIRLPEEGTDLIGFAVGAQALSGDFNFPGLISEFAVYGEVLPEERLTAHFMAGIATDNGASASAVPEPSAVGLLLVVSLLIGICRQTHRP